MKIINLEILRAVAASLVVVYHTLGGLILKSVNIGPMVFFYPLGSAGVDIFFVISGFVIYLSLAKRHNKPTIFLKSRFRRIIPAYWIATFLTVSFTFIYGYLAVSFGLENSLRPISPLWLVESLFFASNVTGNGMPVVGQGWTLEYEMLFYILVALGLVFQRRIIVFIFPAVVLFSLAISNVLSVMVIEFILGMVIAVLFNKIKISSFLALSSLIVGIALFAMTAFTGPEFNPSRISWILGSFFVVLGCVYLPQIKSSFALKLGAASYAVYLLHALTYPVVNFGFGIVFKEMNLVLVVSCVALSLLLAQVAGMFFETKIDKPLRLFLASKGF